MPSTEESVELLALGPPPPFLPPDVVVVVAAEDEPDVDEVWPDLSLT